MLVCISSRAHLRLSSQVQGQALSYRGVYAQRHDSGGHSRPMERIAGRQCPLRLDGAPGAVAGLETAYKYSSAKRAFLPLHGTQNTPRCAVAIAKVQMSARCSAVSREITCA